MCEEASVEPMHDKGGQGLLAPSLRLVNKQFNLRETETAYSSYNSLFEEGLCFPHVALLVDRTEKQGQDAPAAPVINLQSCVKSGKQMVDGVK